MTNENATTKQIKRPRGFGFHSIRFKTWLYFIAMTILILAVLLGIQVFFFSFYYSNMKMSEIERVGENVKKNLSERRDNPSFKYYLDQIASTNGFVVAVFSCNISISETEVSVANVEKMFVSSSVDGNDSINLADLTKIAGMDSNFFTRISYDKPFISNTRINDVGYIIYGIKTTDPTAPNKEVVLYMSSPIEENSVTLNIIKRQTYFSMIVSIVLSLLLSWLVSSRIAGPVTDFSKTARRLAEGDFDVRFTGNGIEEIETLAETLNYATQEMGKTEILRRELLANVSHDLRTPLTMVKAYAEMIRDISGNDKEKRIAHSQVIIDEADRLTTLVNDIQNLSKLQSGTDAAVKTETDLSKTTKRVVERFDIYEAKEGYEFNLSTEENCLIYADEGKIEQVLYNLIGNAINYSGEDKKITLYVKNCDGDVYFGVKDTGKGIAPEDITTVWDRYYRTGQAKRTQVGTGLGLSIVKNILVLHGAEFGVKSALGEGSLFWFSMPSVQKLKQQQEEMLLKEKPKKEKKSKKDTPENACEEESENLNKD